MNDLIDHIVDDLGRDHLIDQAIIQAIDQQNNQAVDQASEGHTLDLQSDQAIHHRVIIIVVDPIRDRDHAHRRDQIINQAIIPANAPDDQSRDLDLHHLEGIRDQTISLAINQTGHHITLDHHLHPSNQVDDIMINPPSNRHLLI